MRATVFELNRAERELLASLAEFFATGGTDRTEMRRRLQRQITQWRTVRRSFYGSKLT